MSNVLTPLYELVAYRNELETLADSGEIPPEQIADTLNALEGDIQEKAVAVAMFSRNLEATAEAIREAAKAMLTRAERVQRRAESVQQYLLYNMQAAGITKIEAPQFVLAVRKNPPAVIVDDEAQIPADFMVQPAPPPPRPDKTAIKRELQAGHAVPGAHLLQSERLEIRT